MMFEESLPQSVPDFLICSIPQDMDENPDTGWCLGILYSGRTTFLDELLIHVGVLSSGKTPHPPHCHDHEEAHITLSDHVEFISTEAFPDGQSIKFLDNRALVFTDSNISHTFRNNGPLPASYIHIRWRNTSTSPGITKEQGRFHFSPLDKDTSLKRLTRNGVDITDIYSGPSRFLPCLTVLFITIPENGEIPLHRHDHEVIFVLIKGTVEILGKTVEAPGLAFMKSRMPHHMINTGNEPAELYAFELHREG
jgi:hypothetical protein